MSKDDPAILRLAREGAAQQPAQPVDLGARLRELRRDRDWTLEQAAQRSGLARSTLSKIEKGQMSPTYEAVKKLAQGLGMTVPQLFTPPRREQVSGRLTLTLAGQGNAQVTPTYEHEILAGGLIQKAMLPYRARIRARSFQEFDGWVRHDGEEFLYVLTGRIRLLTEFYEPAELGRGDSAYYDAAMGHNVVSVSEDDATILWVTTLR